MIGATVIVPSLARARKLQAHAEAEVWRAIPRAERDAAHATMRRLALDAKSQKLVDVGIYKGSFEVRQTRGSRAGLPGWQVTNTAPHAGVIELGARPFRPPLKPLLEWARRKAVDLGIVQRPGGRFRGKATLTDAEDQAAYRFARAVQGAIGRRGLRPRRIFANRLPYARAALRRAFEEFLRQIAATGRAG